MIKLKIDVLKIEKERLFKGAKGTYLDAVLIDSPDQYGNDGFISQDVSKEERQQGMKGTIIGSWKHIGGAKPQQKAPPAKQSPPHDPDLDADADGGIPF